MPDMPLCGGIVSRLRRAVRVVAPALMTAAMVAGCSLDQTALAPAGVVATAAPLPPCGEPARGETTVNQVLADARRAAGGPTAAAGQPTPATAATGAARADCVAQAPRKPVTETGALRAPTASPAMAGGAQIAPAPSATATAAAATEELFIDFEPSAVSLGDKEIRAAREAIALRLAGGGKAVRISAARGGSGNWFDQAVVAQRRARAVNELVPPRMVLSSDFDPTLPEDTVRVQFVRQQKSSG